jgi:hypothetical protein
MVNNTLIGDNMNIILRNMLIAFIAAFWVIATAVILVLPKLLGASPFWFLLSLPSAAAWAAFWCTIAWHYDQKGVEL